MINMFIL